jgi:hypothetical protein
MKRKKPDLKAVLPCRTISLLADRIAQEMGVRKPPFAAVRAMYDSRIPLPICIDGSSKRLWVDKYYIAFQVDGGYVRYAYLARRHIEEELKSYGEASAARGQDVRLPQDVHRAFVIALRAMKANGESIWIRNNCAPNCTKVHLSMC